MATLKELSEMTGYSMATISRVLNGDSTLKVTENTRKSIIEAAGQLDYSSKRTARRQNNPKEHLKIGIVEMATAEEAEKDPYYLYLKSSVEKCCFANGMETFIMQYDEKENLYRCAAPRELDGILAIGQFRPEQIVSIKKSTHRIVFVDSSPFPEKFCSVIPDYEVGIRQGMDYLIRQGHRKIVFVGPEFSTDAVGRPSPELRRKIFTDYAARSEEHLEVVLLDTEWQADDVIEKVTAYVEGLKEDDVRPTAFFTYNEPTAMGVLRALQMMGYQVPDNFSILSYNDTSLAMMTTPQLSSICIQIEEMAENAVWLIERIAKWEK